MRYLLDNGYYMTNRHGNVSSVVDDNGRGFFVSCDDRMSDDEMVKTMAQVIPFITPRIA